MVEKRVTPEDDYYRLAERVMNNYGDKISDASSFNHYLLNYIKLLPKNHDLRKEDNVEKVQEFAVQQHFVEEIEKIPVEKIKERKVKKDFDVVGFRRGRTTFAREEFVKIKNKRVVRYRDERGMFVSVKKV